MPSPDPRVVLITGAANGIGWATARRFATTGDLVVLVDIDGVAAHDRARSLPGCGHLAVAADLGDPAGTKAMIADLLARCGRIGVLVNNAGRIDARATPAIDVDVSDFRRLLAVNLQGGYVAARAAAPAMLRQGGGAIVNLASGAGIAAIPYRNAYGASKGGVIAMTRALAGAWPGGRVNVVAPGYIRTEMVDSLARNGKIDLPRVERRIPLGRTEEIAEASISWPAPMPAASMAAFGWRMAAILRLAAQATRRNPDVSLGLCRRPTRCRADRRQRGASRPSRAGWKRTACAWRKLPAATRPRWNAGSRQWRQGKDGSMRWSPASTRRRCRPASRPRTPGRSWRASKRG